MKKSVLYSLMASVSMFSIGAYAEDASTSALTTKGYVDTGLKYVYDSIKGDVTNVQENITNIQNALSDGNGGLVDVGDLADTVGTAGSQGVQGTGLVGAVEALQDTVGNTTLTTSAPTVTGAINELKNAIDNSAIDGANTGIRINNKKVQLDISNPSTNTTYVFKTDNNGNGTWQAMEVEDSWNPGFLTTPANP